MKERLAEFLAERFFCVMGEDAVLIEDSRDGSFCDLSRELFARVMLSSIDRFGEEMLTAEWDTSSMSRTRVQSRSKRNLGKRKRRLGKSMSVAEAIVDRRLDKGAK